MANYDANLEKVIKEETINLDRKLKARAKVYSYNGGDKKFKLLFIGETQKRKEFYTTKFPALVTQKEVQKLTKLMTDVSGELK